MKSHKATNSKNYNSLATITGILFVLLAFLASRFPFFYVDQKISLAIQSIQGRAFFNLMNYISEIGDDYHIVVLVGLTALGLIYVRRHFEAVKVVLYSAGSALAGIIIKNIVARPRPTVELVKIHEQLFDYSFPSLHVLFFTTFFGYLLYLSLYKFKNFWLRVATVTVSSFLILTIGLSRIYLGAHWASDVIGGYLLGALFIRFIIHAER